MEKNIANELKKLDVEIAKKLFSISKEFMIKKLMKSIGEYKKDTIFRYYKRKY